jgi:mono/diheme cytochrome c family protein
MRATVRVLSQEDFATWVKERESGGGKPDTGAAVFAESGCGGCHTFAPAGSNGEVGPGLDNIVSVAQKAGRDPAEFVREAIVDPGKNVAPPYQDGVMPSNYGETLSPEEIDALVAYVTGAKQ